MRKAYLHNYFSKFEILYIFLSLLNGVVSTQWVGNENEGYEYYYNGSDEARVFSYNEAESKCAENNATLVMIKTIAVEDFILTQSWTSKLSETRILQLICI